MDSVDQMTRNFSVQAPTRRWPIQVWSNMINIAIINAWVLFKIVNKSKINRRKFIINLIEEIIDLVSDPKENTPSTNHTITPKTTKNKLNKTPTTPTYFARKRPGCDVFQEIKKRQILDASPSTKYCQIRKCNNNKCIQNSYCNKCKKALCGQCISVKISLFLCKNCD